MMNFAKNFFKDELGAELATIGLVQPSKKRADFLPLKNHKRHKTPCAVLGQLLACEHLSFPQT